MSSDDNDYSVGSKKAKYSLLVIKLLELCLLICCIGLIDEPSTASSVRVFISQRTISLCYVTFGSLIIYTGIYILMALLGDTIPWRTSLLWAFVGLVLYVASTAMLFRDWAKTKDLNYWHPNMHLLDLVLASAAVSLVTSLVYVIDILITLRFGSRGYVE